MQPASDMHFIQLDTKQKVSYGAEAWTLTKKEEKALLIFERKIFRRIYGPTYENGEWKSRTNRELERLTKEKI